MDDVQSIHEIGGGYGGQAVFLQSLTSQDVEYTIYDLDKVLPLISKFTKTAAVKNVKLRSLPPQEPVSSDLVISNYAFSELS